MFDVKGRLSQRERRPLALRKVTFGIAKDGFLHRKMVCFSLFLFAFLKGERYKALSY